MSDDPQPEAHVPARLGLWDAVSIIIGIVVGAGIFETPPLVLRNLPDIPTALGAWALGGVLSLIGALCYAELASTYPRSGGDYIYLTRAYSPLFGFLFAWAQMAVILTGNIGMMAYVFADYSVRLFGGEPYVGVVCAAGAVVVLTLLNLLGVVFGKRTQNLLSTIKVVGLLAIVAAGLLWPAAPRVETAQAAGGGSFTFAMVLIFLTYGGWSDAAYVAAEVREGPRIVPRALLLGTGFITLIYLLVNAAYLSSLGLEGARQSKAIAADVLAGPLGAWGERGMCLVVMMSALGSINGLIFAGSRIYARLGADYPLFGWLGQWDRGRGAPYGALLTQAAISLGLIFLVGSQHGRAALDALAAAVGLGTLTWEGHGGYETLLRCCAPIFWIFFLLTSIALFILRVRDADRPRPFTVPLFPLLPLIFTATCGYMIYSAVNYAGSLGLVGAGLLALGLPLYWISAGQRRSSGTALSAQQGKDHP